MGLETIRTGKHPRPPKTVIYGGAKVGKSTFGSTCAAPIFVPTEEGLDALDVHSFPLAGTFVEVLQHLATLAREEHEYRTVVLDSLDWTEPLIWDHVCREHAVDSIEAVGGGYGKGYTEAVKVWRRLLSALDHLRDHRGMSVLLIAHDEIRKMEPPDSEGYDYAALKLHKKAAGVVEEWADIIGYARTKQRLKTEDQGFGKERRIVDILNGGERVLTVGQHPAYVSGNRYGLPDEVPLAWPELAAALREAFAEDDQEDTDG